MIIREASEGDFPSIVAAIEDFVAHSSYAQFDRVNGPHVVDTLKALCASPDGLVLAMEDEGCFVGCFVGAKHAHLFSGEPMCGELFVWVRPDMRGQGKALKARVEEWARGRGCKSMTFSFPESEAHLDTVYRKWGYAPLERSYRKELS